MAISRNKKETLVADFKALLENAKLTAFAEYGGLSVAELQELRRVAREAGVKIKVVKNRILKIALGEIAVYKDTDATGLTGQLLYSFSDGDEVMAAKVLSEFAKKHDFLKIKGGFTAEGALLSEDETKALAALPSKDELIGSVVNMLISPLTDTVSGLNSLAQVISGLEAHATK